MKKIKKRRPFICLYKVNADSMIGFQITSSDSSPLCKYPLIDWKEYALRKKSFVNIHHTVLVYRNELKFTKAKNLTKEDTAGLIDFMRKLDQHDKKTGYKATYNIETEIENLEKSLK